MIASRLAADKTAPRLQRDTAQRFLGDELFLRRLSSGIEPVQAAAVACEEYGHTPAPKAICGRCGAGSVTTRQEWLRSKGLV